eukprot:888407-Rhodomonas_salina.1
MLQAKLQPCFSDQHTPRSSISVVQSDVDSVLASLPERRIVLEQGLHPENLFCGAASSISETEGGLFAVDGEQDKGVEDPCGKSCLPLLDAPANSSAGCRRNVRDPKSDLWQTILPDGGRGYEIRRAALGNGDHDFASLWGQDIAVFGCHAVPPLNAS